MTVARALLTSAPVANGFCTVLNSLDERSQVSFALMNATVTERSNCRFIVRTSKSDKPQLVLELFQSISSLKNTKLGLELLGGTSIEQAKKVAALLNEHVLNVFVEGDEPK